jgi:hypothetical protein
MKKNYAVLNSLKKVSLFILLSTAAYVTQAQSTFQWAKMNASSIGAVISGDIVTDAMGNTYSTGYFNGNADFDPGLGVYSLTTTPGQQDIYILKLDASGNFVWAKQMGSSTGYDQGTSIAIDANGNVYLTGFFTGVADFDPSASTFTLASLGGQQDGYILKLNAAGNFVWAKHIGGTNNEAGISITADASGNVYTTGSFQGTVDFDPNAGLVNLTSLGATDIFTLKLDANGNFVWVNSIGSSAGDAGNGITLDVAGNIYVTGLFSGVADFDSSTGTYTLTTTGNSYNAFATKLDASGNFLWAKNLGGSISNDITLDLLGNVYTTGEYSGSRDFDPSAGSFSLTSAGSTDIFISKLDGNGDFIWAKSMGSSTGTDLGQSITTDASGNVYTIGTFEGISDFDPNAGTTSLTSNGQVDIFISKLDALGNFVWVNGFGGPNSDRGRSIALDAIGNVYSNGYFDGTVDFNPNVGVFNLTSTSVYSSYVLKLGQTASVGINKLSSIEKSISIYPNPTKELLNVELPADFGSAQLPLIITNVLGEVVLTERLITQHSTLNIQNLNPGVYFLQIGNSKAIKFIKE